MQRSFVAVDFGIDCLITVTTCLKQHANGNPLVFDNSTYLFNLLYTMQVNIDEKLHEQ